MPVTKTAKRALRSSKRKENINKSIRNRLGVAMRLSKREKTEKKIRETISLIDRAAKRKIIHKNKAARMKSAISKILPRKSSKTLKKTAKK